MTFGHGSRPWIALPDTAVTLLAGLLLSTASPARSDDAASSTYDGLVPIEGARVAHAYVDPDADFSVYRRVSILEPHVAFRKGWQRDQNRSGRQRVRSSDMERIKKDVAALFEDVFREVLQADDGYEVVDGVGDDVLILRPAIIDLDVTAPDTGTAGRSQTFTTTAGAATLYIELFDSVTGDIIGRAADRRTARNAGSTIAWSNRVSNTAEARRMLRHWAGMLRDFLDRQYEPGEAVSKASAGKR